MTHKINVGRRVFYVALNCQEHLTDLILSVRLFNGSLVADIPMTEASGGIYFADYTPAILGTLREEINSVSNGDHNLHCIEVVAKTVVDVDSHLDAVEIKVNNIESKVIALESAVNAMTLKVNSIETKVDAALVLLNTINNKVDSNDDVPPESGYVGN